MNWLKFELSKINTPKNFMRELYLILENNIDRIKNILELLVDKFYEFEYYICEIRCEYFDNDRSI
jgi:hypothetical protein